MTGSAVEPTPSAEQAAEQMRDATDRIRDHWTVIDLTSAAAASPLATEDVVDSL